MITQNNLFVTSSSDERQSTNIQSQKTIKKITRANIERTINNTKVRTGNIAIVISVVMEQVNGYFYLRLLLKL